MKMSTPKKKKVRIGFQQSLEETFTSIPGKVRRNIATSSFCLSQAWYKGVVPWTSWMLRYALDRSNSCTTSRCPFPHAACSGDQPYENEICNLLLRTSLFWMLGLAPAFTSDFTSTRFPRHEAVYRGVRPSLVLEFRSGALVMIISTISVLSSSTTYLMEHKAFHGNYQPAEEEWSL